MGENTAPPEETVREQSFLELSDVCNTIVVVVTHPKKMRATFAFSPSPQEEQYFVYEVPVFRTRSSRALPRPWKHTPSKKKRTLYLVLKIQI